MYNGHKNWNHWNVALWVANDEGLYNCAKVYKRALRNSLDAAKAMLEDLRGMGLTHTPDGAPYSVTTLAAAIRGLE